MGSNYSALPPFPDDIDQIEFGHWLSGITDGEGASMLYWNKWRKESSEAYGLARFVIGLRSDDIGTLELIQSFLGCGNILRENREKTGGNPISRLTVSRIADLAGIVVPHFDKYPLRSKKANDFRIWRQGVSLAFGVNQLRYRRGEDRKTWTPDARREFEIHLQALKATRVYRSGNSVA